MLLLDLAMKNCAKITNYPALRHLTSKVSKIQDEKYVTGIFSSIDERQRSCIILMDEVYVKHSLQYHRGHVFGKAENNPDAHSEYSSINHGQVHEWRPQVFFIKIYRFPS